MDWLTSIFPLLYDTRALDDLLSSKQMIFRHLAG
jgi:hypothetical protein